VTSKLIDGWRRRRRTSPRIDELTFHEGHATMPEQIPRHTLAIVGTLERPKWAVFECPCGRGHQLALNLSPRAFPFWTVTQYEHGPSLSPSVDSHRPARCHFWLRDGRVNWVYD
jgi:hypothetical protein